MHVVRQFTERFSNVKAAKRAEQKVAPQPAPQPLDASQLRQVGGGLKVPAPKNGW
ncbi:hypothetical protein [Methylibium sp.]|uniref:hypothetical protein n=1 Tax=Methylibium sp. TaxID=2067992 RepID=UPI003D0C6143